MASIQITAHADMRSVEAILATTDVHSALEDPLPLLGHLHRVRPTTLVVDCGDFFEGSGYYLLAGGALERRILARLYDVLAPGNHGFRFHLRPDLRPLTVCANLVGSAGQPLFRPLRWARVAGRLVAITAVLGRQAFDCLPPADRAGVGFVDPAAALRDLAIAHQADAWVVLSHSGYEHDMALAQECPHVDVFFSGHCHSDHHRPVLVGDTVIVKGFELGAGYASATPEASHWRASVNHFPPADEIPSQLSEVMQQIGMIRSRLQSPLGFLAPRFQHGPVNLAGLLTAVAAELREPEVDAVVLNQTSLRATDLSEHLALGDLLHIEPFSNRLVAADVPAVFADNPRALLAVLTESMGPIIIAPDPLPRRLRRIITTGYVAATFLDTPHATDRGPLAEIIQRLMVRPADRQGDLP
ncbi:metallophosphoesterase [Nonomuraea sp. NPDC004702]